MPERIKLKTVPYIVESTTTGTFETLDSSTKDIQVGYCFYASRIDKGYVLIWRDDFILKIHSMEALHDFKILDYASGKASWKKPLEGWNLKLSTYDISIKYD